MPEWFQKKDVSSKCANTGTKRKKETKGKEKQVRKSGSERGGKGSKEREGQERRERGRKGSKEREGRERRERRKVIQPCRELDGAEGAVERGTKRK